MSKRSALAVAVAVGFSLWGCSDEKAGPGVGPDTSWRIRCSDEDPTMTCGTDQAPHGPLDGSDPDTSSDDYKFSVTCSRPGSGLALTITDQGRERNVDKQQNARARSVLSISRADPESNECVVAVTEYPLSGEPAELKVQETCSGNSTGDGTCEFTGSFNSNGYAFEGTVRCDGLKYKGNGPGAWVLTSAIDRDEPVTLQIANCD